MFRKLRTIVFFPASFFLWFLFAYYTLDRSTGEPVLSFSAVILFIILIFVYLSIIFRRFKKLFFILKVRARWFFYYFLASAIVILLFETVPFLDKLEYSKLLGLFAFLLLASCGISFILSLSFGIKTFFNKKLIRKMDLKKLTHKLRTAKGVALLSLLVVAGFLFGALTQNALLKDFLGIQTNQESVQSPSIAPTSIPTPTSTEVIQEEKYIAPTNDPDPIVDCNFKYVGTKKIRSSECSKSFECQIGSQWYIYSSKGQCSQDQGRDTSTKWNEYRISRIKDLKAALKITEDQIPSYKNDLDNLTKNYNQVISSYQAGSMTQSEFESTSKKFIEADNFIRASLKKLAESGDTYINLIRRFENGENISPAEEKAILGN